MAYLPLDELLSSLLATSDLHTVAQCKPTSPFKCFPRCLSNFTLYWRKFLHSIMLSHQLYKYILVKNPSSDCDILTRLSGISCSLYQSYNETNLQLSTAATELSGLLSAGHGRRSFCFPPLCSPFLSPRRAQITGRLPT